MVEHTARWNISHSVMWLFPLLAIIGIWVQSKGSLAVQQSDVDYIGRYVELRYGLHSNLIEKALYYSSYMVLKNTGNRTISHGDWTIYFNHLRIIVLPEGYNGTRYDPAMHGVSITHINGCLFKLETTNRFHDLKPGRKLTIFFMSHFWSVARSDVFPNWYVTAENCTPRTLSSTDDQSLSFVDDFDSRKKWKRYDYKDATSEVHDRYDPFTPEVRYERNRIRNLGANAMRAKIIPSPLQQTGKMRDVRIGSDWVIVVTGLSTQLNPAALYLKDYLPLPIQSSKPETRYIELVFAQPEDSMHNTSVSDEAYVLHIDFDREHVSIKASTDRGAFYAVQSMRHLADSKWRLPDVTIRDMPRFEYRGMHLDVGRNFHCKTDVMKLLDTMAYYKLNMFHFHLTEDEAWRIEIPGLVELTEVGSKQCADLTETDCLIPQLGSGPSTATSGSGFYTVEDYKEILRFAAKRHITVIPEIDMPGHARAAIKAMEARYRKLAFEGNTADAVAYLLSDLDDKSIYKSVQYFSDNAVNPCINSTYDFIKHVIGAFVSLHRDIQPLTNFHFGGDEVPEGAWINSPKCVEFLRLNPQIHNVTDLKKYFVQRVAYIANNYSLHLSGWEDGLIGEEGVPFTRDTLPNRLVVANAWNNVWEWGGAQRAYILANAGYKVVMSQATHLYFDHPHEPDPEERGFYWAARFTDTRKVFSFMPDQLYANADVTRSGDAVTQEMVCGEAGDQCTPLQKTENIIGMQGSVWTETMRTPGDLYSMIFPRMLALAERAWHKGPFEEDTSINNNNKKALDAATSEYWTMFANILGHKELLKLDQLEIPYHITPPGARQQSNRLLVTAEFPGLIVEHSKDNGRTWSTSRQLDGKSRTILLRTRSADGSRYSRIVNMKTWGHTNTVADSMAASHHQSYLLTFLLYIIGKSY